MAKVSITELARQIVQKHHLTQTESERIISVIIDVINEGLRYEKQVKVKGLGTFKVIETKDRESVNVNTGERIVIEGRGKITFTPDVSMRDMVNRPFSQFETVVINEGVTFEDIEMSTETQENEEGISVEVADETSMAEETSSMPTSAPPAAIVALANLGDEQIIPEEALREESVKPIQPETEQPANAEQPQLEIVVENTPEKESSSETNEKEPSVEVKEVEEKIARTEHHHHHHSNSSSHRHSSESSESHHYHRHMYYDHLLEKQEKHFKKRLSWLTTMGAIAALLLVVGAYYFGKRVGVNEFRNEMALTGVDFLSEDSIARIMEADARADSLAQVQLMEKRRQDYAVKKRAVEFTRHSENIDESSRQRAEELTQANMRKQAADMERLEVDKQAQREAAAKAESKADAQIKAKSQTMAKAQTQVQVKDQAPTKAPVANNNGGFPSAKYDEMSAQVRLGAYRIVGVDQTVTVRKGQSLASISKAFLGPGMECYVEALNGGIKSVTEGQILKIPKLELRKKAKTNKK